MVYTLVINIIMFLMLLIFFEFNRHYRQIFLKRLQKRFIDIGKVPPIPARHIFGWLVAVFKVPELDVLHMVGLDGYMLLRYHTICLKFTLFATASGELWTFSTVSYLQIHVDFSKFPCTSFNRDICSPYIYWVSTTFRASIFHMDITSICSQLFLSWNFVLAFIVAAL